MCSLSNPSPQINRASFSCHPYMSSMDMWKVSDVLSSFLPSFPYPFSSTDLIPEPWKELEVSPLILSTPTPTPHQTISIQWSMRQNSLAHAMAICLHIYLPQPILQGRSVYFVSLSPTYLKFG